MTNTKVLTAKISLYVLYVTPHCTQLKGAPFTQNIVNGVLWGFDTQWPCIYSTNN